MAEAQFVKSNRKYDLECAVCLDRFRDPRTLTCNHHFCRKCLIPLIENRRIRCPLCKQDTSVGYYGVNELPCNTEIRDEISKVCETCLYEDREIHCDLCNMWFCQECHIACEWKHKFTGKNERLLNQLEGQREALKEKRQNLITVLRGAVDEVCNHEDILIRRLRKQTGRYKDQIRHEQSKRLDDIDRLSWTIDKLTKKIKESAKEQNAREDDTHDEEYDKNIEEWSADVKEYAEYIKEPEYSMTFTPGEIWEPDVGSIEIPSESHLPIVEHFVFGSRGTGPGQFMTPTRIVVSHITRNFFVLDSGNSRVTIFNSQYEFIDEVGGTNATEERKLNFLDHFGGLTITDDGLLVVADVNNNRLQVFTEKGKYIRMIGKYGKEPGEFDLPQGLAARGKRIYVCDYGNNRIQILDTGGEFIRQFGNEELFKPQQPVDITVCQNNDILVTGAYEKYALEGRLFLFSPKGDLKLTMIKETPFSLRLRKPVSVIINNDGHIVTSDYYKNTIHILTMAGKLVRSLGFEGQGLGQLNHPSGLAITKNNDLLVTDTWNHRIQVFSFKERCSTGTKE